MISETDKNCLKRIRDAAACICEMDAVREIYKIYVDRFETIAKQKGKSFSFSENERVCFVSKKGTIHGRITKINPKKVKVYSDQGVSWTVPRYLIKKSLSVHHTSSLGEKP